MLKAIESIAVRHDGVVLLIGRVAIGTLFLCTGWRHLMNLQRFADDIGKDGLIGPLMGWAVLAAVIEFFSSLDRRRLQDAPCRLVADALHARGGVPCPSVLGTRSGAVLSPVCSILEGYIHHRRAALRVRPRRRPAERRSPLRAGK
jgi:hypothetical protein